MNKRLYFFLYLAGCALIFLACNPDCESVASADIKIEPMAILPGSEILLKSNPPDLLRGRKLFINNPDGGVQDLELREEALLEGFVAQMPPEATATTNIFMEDPDCSGLILIDPLQIHSEDFFYFSDTYVVPPTPFIFIPTPAVVPPANITNAWITPYRRSYCIWIVPRLDANGNELKELRPRLETDLSNGFGRFGSHEFVTCGSIGEPERHLSANVNPVSGYVDKENNDIMIRIDRTSKGLGIETFTGKFIDPLDQIPDTDDWRKGGSCGRREGDAKDYMLLTSQTTGQQMLMIKVVP